MITRKAIVQLAESVLCQDGAKTATKYFSPTEVMKVTYIGKRRKGSHSVSVRLTIGRPNWAERQFVKKVQKAGGSFPVKPISLKFSKS